MRYDLLTGTIYVLNRALLTGAGAVRFLKAPGKGLDIDHSSAKTRYPFVFLHGFFGWGQNEPGHDTFAYWGLFSGNTVKRLNASGFTVVAPSVDPVGSAWDRACELYAQLTGTRVDYGKAHSERFGHPRYGKDYTGKPVLPQWDAAHKINIMAHSFGGPTAALLASLLAYGDEEEKIATTDGSLSGLFEGGKQDWIYSICGLAAAYNGTTLHVNHQAVTAIETRFREKCADALGALPAWTRFLPEAGMRKIADRGRKITSGRVARPDTGLYDMHPDHSVLMNAGIRMVPDIYYFSVPFDATRPAGDGSYRVQDRKIGDPFFRLFIHVMGNTDTVTEGGMVLDRRWQHNDGLVNTVSETAPFDKPSDTVNEAPGVALAEKGFSKGVYHVFPTYRGAHMALQGNIFRPEKKGQVELLSLMLMIDAL
ncbi:MAG: hypothetical protein IK104_01520 [Clostridia bacterium]|nr:hypothetical protein [Clostridia bacterium]